MRTRLAAALLGTVALVSGCGGGSNAATATLASQPDPGKAGVWLRSPDHEESPYEVFGSTDSKAAAVGPDGTIWLVNGCGGGVRIDPSRQIHNVDPLSGNGCSSGFNGLVAMADGSLVFATGSYGQNPRIERRDTTGHTTTVAGESGVPRTTAGNTLPSTVDAATVQFTARATPIGTRPDGSVIIMDQDVVWSMKDGRLTRVFTCGRSATTACPVGLGTLGTVDAAGDVYVSVPQSKDDPALLGSLLVITADGVSGPLDLGDSLAKSSSMLSISGDGAHGILVVVTRGAGEVLHVSSGRVTTLMAGKPGVKLGTKCPATFDPTNIPCGIPFEVVAYHSTALLLGGMPDVLAAGIPD
jgi:hypothetical protein